MMNDTYPILFFSDAHFGSHSRTQEALKVGRFVAFLDHAERLGAEVFFLGDLFDFWFEYKHWIPKVPIEVLAAIRGFTRNGGAFHLVLGNHDIWAADYFTRHLGVEVHRRDLTVKRQGLRLLISHGDGKARSDGGYRLLKRVLRFGPGIALYRLLPADWAFRLARFFSGQSRELTASRPPTFLVEYDAAARDYLTSGFDAVVMGHIHHAWVRRLDNGWWVNTGEFFKQFTYVRLQERQFHLETWGSGKETSFTNQDRKSS